MLSKKPPEAGEILQGTLDMLILRTLVTGAAHGHTIAQVIEHTSENAPRGGAGVALSRTASPRRPGLAILGMGRERKQPQGEVLPAHGQRPEGTDRRRRALAQDDARHWPHFG